MLKHLVLVGGLLASARLASADNHITGQVTDLALQPLRDATVLISGAKGLEATVTTDPSGHYAATVPTSGLHIVTVAFGKTRTAKKVIVPDNGTVTVDATLEAGGEIIEVRDRDRPLVYPKPKFDTRKVPTYSDYAVAHDKWSKAWLLLDVDDRGAVQRVKFLKRPGNDLDKIAVQYAFNLTFDPARDQHGYPAKSYIVWALEWPAVGWFESLQLPSTRLPMLPTIQTAHGVMMSTYPPCGAEDPNAHPMNFSDANVPSHHVGLRDCSQPDMTHADATEPWISRDLSQPAPQLAEAKRVDPVQYREEHLSAARTARIAAYTSAVASVGFVAVSVYGFTRLSRAQDRLDADQNTHDKLASGQLDADQHSVRNWELVTLGAATGAVIGGFVSAHYFKKSQAAFALVPNAEGGAMMSVSGGF